MSRHANKNEKEKENEYEEKTDAQTCVCSGADNGSRFIYRLRKSCCNRDRESTRRSGEDRIWESQAAEKTEDDSTSSKDTLVIATANEAPNMTTNLHNATAGEYLNLMTHDRLFYSSEDLTPKPALCESYEIVNDTEWLFHLRKGVKFHNGQEMKAEDVKASLELCKESPQVSQYGQSTGKIEVVDDYTVKIITDGPQSGLLYDLCHHGNAILPAELIASGHDFNKEPIGTGPYKLVEWKKGESIEFVAFEDYWNGEAPIKHVIWKVIPEGSSRTMALETGEVDLVVDVETTDLTRLMESDGIEVFNEAGTTHQWMMINNEVAPFNNADFRKAIASAIDKEAVIQVALQGTGSVSDSMLPGCFKGVTDTGAPSYDVDKAKEYMEASGLNPTDCGFAIICSDDMKLRMGQVDPELSERKSWNRYDARIHGPGYLSGCDSYRRLSGSDRQLYRLFLIGIFPGRLSLHVCQWIQ